MKNRFLTFLIVLGLAGVLVGGTIDLDNLFNYANQEVPDYITRDNTDDNPIDDRTATLGRVLFYDKNLSSDGTIACASCHLQERAFGDTEIQSIGVNGITPRHSMRLVNPRFSDEVRFFWDERVLSLEDQTTKPIQDHIEMGFSGTNGDGPLEDLITHLEGLDYYNTLFTFAYGDASITEERLQFAMAQFIRSIQSFDSRFDDGLAATNDLAAPFPNFTALENQGKALFLNPPGPGGGAGCAACHLPPEFSTDQFMINNGVVTVAGLPGEIDITIKRAPSLRDVVNPDGTLNGPLMHDGSFGSLLEVVNHYNDIPDIPENTMLDPRLIGPNNEPQELNLTEEQKQALVAFIGTLTGSDIYTNEKWSDPFDPDGSIEIIGSNLGISQVDVPAQVEVYPNPVVDRATIEVTIPGYKIWVYDLTGRLIWEDQVSGTQTQIDLSDRASGLYLLTIQGTNGSFIQKKLLKV